MTEIYQIITQVGFPVVCAIAVGMYVKYIQDNNRKDLAEQQRLNREDINRMHETNRIDANAMREAVNGNTLVLRLVLERLGLNEDGTKRKGTD